MFNFMIIKNHYECEGGIVKSILRITSWLHEACQVMTNVDHEHRIFLPHLYMNNGLFFLLITKYFILCYIDIKKTSRKF